MPVSTPLAAPDGNAPDALTDRGQLVMGHVSGLLRVVSSTTVHGRVTGGAWLASGARLEVVGGFRGPAHLQAESMLHVTGVFEGERLGDLGLLVVSGQCELTTAMRPGVVVEIGSMLVDADGTASTITADGELVGLGARRSNVVDADSRGHVFWSELHRRFLPV